MNWFWLGSGWLLSGTGAVMLLYDRWKAFDFSMLMVGLTGPIGFVATVACRIVWHFIDKADEREEALSLLEEFWTDMDTLRKPLQNDSIMERTEALLVRLGRW